MSFTDKKTLSVAEAVKNVLSKKPDPNDINDPRNFNAKDPKMLDMINTNLKNIEAIKKANDVTHSFGKSPEEPKSIPYMPDYKRVSNREISGPITRKKSNEEKQMTTFRDAAIKALYETKKKADKDYDKDGKIESPKDEVWGSRLRAAKMAGKLKEEEQIDEAFPTVADGEKSLKAKEGKTTHGKITKTKTGMKHERDYDDQPEPEVKRGRGRPKKRLSEMRQEYFNYFEEEVDNETFTKELEDQKAKFDGKKKGADVAKPSVQAVKQEEVEQIDEKKGYGESDPLQNRADYAASNKPGQVYKKTHSKDKVGMSKSYAYDIKRTGPKGKLPEEVELDERTLSSDEMSKREDYVKGMKKKMAGFKQRYGERAKSVMYATATKMAKKD